MTYLEMVRNATNKSEKIMWESVAAFSELLERLKAAHPDVYRKFYMAEYGRLYGRHFDENMAREIVNAMHHVNNNGERMDGEYFSPEVADNVSAETGAQKWDVYVCINALAHDLARTALSDEQIIAIAREFWFADDDFDGENKVFWYFANK